MMASFCGEAGSSLGPRAVECVVASRPRRRSNANRADPRRGAERGAAAGAGPEVGLP